MAAPILYRSDDASAPVLSNGVSTLIDVLDACLVNGYGSKAAAGWTKPYTGTNKAAFRMGTGGTARQMYLRVDDTVAQFAATRGYDTMTDVDTGLEPFPTVGQYAVPGLQFNKSNVASGSAVRPWWLLATPTCFYFSAFTNVIGASAYPATFTNDSPSMFFGEYVSYMGGGFTHHVAHIGGTYGLTAGFGSHLCTVYSTSVIGDIAGHYVCRISTGVSGSSGFSKNVMMHAHYGTSTTNPFGRSNGSAWVMDPETVAGKLRGGRCRILHPLGGSYSRAGHLPGLWCPHVPVNGAYSFGTIDGSGAAAGRSLLLLDVGGGANTNAGSNANGRGFFDMTNFD